MRSFSISHANLASATQSWIRWIVFIAISLALHAMLFLNSSGASTWHFGMAPAETSIEARLVALTGPVADAATVQTPREPSNTIADAPPPAIKRNPAEPVRSNPSHVFSEMQYAKAGELSVRPSPIDEIRVPSPDKAPAAGIVTTILTLFVDEDGSVANLTFDDPALLQPFRDAVQSAFSKARFNPGRIAERPVKSRIRIEVTFEPNPEDVARGVSGRTGY